MTIYTINATKGTETFMPELTASEFLAIGRKQDLEAKGYSVNLFKYEVKTQGKNFHTLATPELF